MEKFKFCPNCWYTNISMNLQCCPKCNHSALQTMTRKKLSKKEIKEWKELSQLIEDDDFIGEIK